MPAPVHDLYAVKIADALLGGIQAQNLAPNPSVSNEHSSGHLDPQFVALRGQSPTMGFSTFSIKDAIDLVGLLGYDIAANVAGFTQYAQAHADGGTRSAGATHKSYQSLKGMLVPRTLSVDHQGDAVLTVEGVVTWDGAAALPVIVSDAVALPAGLPGDVDRFTLGPALLGGITFTAKRSLSIDFGLGLVPEGADSDIWPTFASIRRRAPSLTLGGIDPDWFSEASGIGLEGLLANNASTSVFLRKRKLGGTFVDDATPEHIQFQMQGLVEITDGQSAQTNEPSTTSLILTAYEDDVGNPPLAVNTATAIP